MSLFIDKLSEDMQYITLFSDSVVSFPETDWNPIHLKYPNFTFKSVYLVSDKKLLGI